MTSLRKNIIDLIERNRISSTEVADALGKSGVIEGLTPLIGGYFKVGVVEYVYAFNESNWSLHQQIENVKEGCIVYVDGLSCAEKAIFGDLVAKYLILYKKVKAIVVNGFLRDAHSLNKERYPIWLKGVTPIGCYNHQPLITDNIKDEAHKKKAEIDKGIMVCDDSGCTLIQPDQITIELFKHLEFVEIQEDIWFYCLDTLKWSTYEIVCLKKYLEHPELLPLGLREKLISVDLDKNTVNE